VKAKLGLSHALLPCPSCGHVWRDHQGEKGCRLCPTGVCRDHHGRLAERAPLAWPVVGERVVVRATIRDGKPHLDGWEGEATVEEVDGFEALVRRGSESVWFRPQRLTAIGGAS
jgi:hypothetical protein